MKAGPTLLRRVRSLVGQAFASDKGNVAVIFALTLPIIVGGLGYGVETSYWYLARNRMQGAADAAAHAGAMEARTGAPVADIIVAAQRGASDNGFTDMSAVTVNVPPTTGPSAGSNRAVEVILAANVDRVFTGIFSSADVTLSTRAVARYNSASTACILALHPTAGQAAYFQGNTTVSLNGCSVMANSMAANAVANQGSSVLSVDCLIAVGGVQVNSNVTLNNCDAPVTYTAPVGDPFANVPVPPTPLACQNDNQVNLSPGRYCNGLTLRNNRNLAPGVYVIEGGDFRVNANANVTGSGVTFYIKSGVDVNMNGNAKMVLSAPTSGTYSGMLFFGDRNSTGTVTLNGTADSLFTGAIYFKNRAVDYLGNFSGLNGCTQVVARTIYWSGNSTINADCSALGMTAIPAMMVVKLTE